MTETRLSFPEIGMIAATRGMLGAGIGILLGSRLDENRRKTIGWALVALGAITTVPLVLMALHSQETDRLAIDREITAPETGSAKTGYATTSEPVPH